MLHPLSSSDLFTLNYIYIPRINLQLHIFRDFYSLRTARNQSPLQLWMSGMANESGDEAALKGVLENPFVSTCTCISHVFPSMLLYNYSVCVLLCILYLCRVI